MKQFNFSTLKLLNMQIFQHVPPFYAGIFSFYAFLKVIIKGVYLPRSIHFILHLILNFIHLCYTKIGASTSVLFFQLNCSKLCSDMKFNYFAMENTAIQFWHMKIKIIPKYQFIYFHVNSQWKPSLKILLQITHTCVNFSKNYLILTIVTHLKQTFIRR